MQLLCYVSAGIYSFHISLPHTCNSIFLSAFGAAGYQRIAIRKKRVGFAQNFLYKPLRGKPVRVITPSVIYLYHTEYINPFCIFKRPESNFLTCELIDGCMGSHYEIVRSVYERLHEKTCFYTVYFSAAPSGRLYPAFKRRIIRRSLRREAKHHFPAYRRPALGRSWRNRQSDHPDAAP